MHKLHPEMLTAKQELFLKEYFSNGENAHRAYAVVLGVPYEKMTKVQKRYAMVGYLGNKKIKAILDKSRAKVAARTEVMLEKFAASKEKVLEELAKIAFTKATDVMSWGPDGVEVKSSDEIDPDAVGAIADITEVGPKDNKKVMVKMVDKRQALETLGRALGLFVDKHQHEHKSLNVSFVIQKD